MAQARLRRGSYRKIKNSQRLRVYQTEPPDAEAAAANRRRSGPRSLLDWAFLRLTNTSVGKAPPTG